SQAQILIVRLLGGRSYWSYGLEVIKELATENGIALWVLPGDDQPDGELMSHSSLPVYQVHQLWQYCQEGGRENWQQGLQWVSNLCLGTKYAVLPPQMIPNVGSYHILTDDQTPQVTPENPKVGVLFYRSHYLAGNTLVIDELCQALQAQGLNPIPFYVSSLRDPDVQEQMIQQLQRHFQTISQEPVKLILNTTSFSLAQLQSHGIGEDFIPLWQQLDIPVLQVILSGGTQAQWQESLQGLNPRDLAMNVALPEVDGRIITRAISFKALQEWHETLQTPVMAYQSVRDRLDFVAELSKNYLNLSQTPPFERKIAIILANYPNKDGRLANGVGLDTPASCLNLLHALKEAGYIVENLPETTDELIQRLTSGITNDLESQEHRQIYQFLPLEAFQTYFQSLPNTVQQPIRDRWSNNLSSLLSEPATNLPPFL
ncbi:MAG: cobaltochelatase subunit CobN, partial [Microcystaceae cyanobacterium]